jgi:glycerol-3-phosphate dehydrogenase
VGNTLTIREAEHVESRVLDGRVYRDTRLGVEVRVSSRCEGNTIIANEEAQGLTASTIVTVTATEITTRGTELITSCGVDAAGNCIPGLSGIGIETTNQTCRRR